MVNFFQYIDRFSHFFLVENTLKYFKLANTLKIRIDDFPGESSHLLQGDFVITLSPVIILSIIILCCFFILFYITVFDLCVNVIASIRSFKIGLTIFYVKLNN